VSKTAWANLNHPCNALKRTAWLHGQVVTRSVPTSPEFAGMLAALEVYLDGTVSTKWN